MAGVRRALHDAPNAAQFAPRAAGPLRPPATVGLGRVARIPPKEIDGRRGGSRRWCRLTVRRAAPGCALALALLAGCANTADRARPPTLDAQVPDAGETTRPGSLSVGSVPDAGNLPDIVRPDAVVVRPDAVVVRPDVVFGSDDVDAAAPLDVSAPDVADAGPPEVCGNGLDDNLDGRVDEDCPSTRCPVPAAPRTTVVLDRWNAPPSLVAAISALGMRLESRGVNPANLPTTAVVVTYMNTAYAPQTADALRAWVESGGALMTVIVGVGDPEECDPSNVLLARFGLRYDCTTTPPWGPVTEFLPHPITAGLTPENSPFVNGRAVSARPGVINDPVARIGTEVAARASTPGCGRVLAWGDEHVLLASYGLVPQRFWERTLAWLAGAR